MTDRYIDPNSGAASQPGGFASAPVMAEAAGFSDVAVADEVTEAQDEEEAEKAAKAPAKAAPAKMAPAKAAAKTAKDSGT